MGYSPWGRKEWDLSVHAHMHAVCVSPLKRQNTEVCSALCDPPFTTLCKHTTIHWWDHDIMDPDFRSSLPLKEECENKVCHGLSKKSRHTTSLVEERLTR